MASCSVSVASTHAEGSRVTTRVCDDGERSGGGVEGVRGFLYPQTVAYGHATGCNCALTGRSPARVRYAYSVVSARFA